MSEMKISKKSMPIVPTMPTVCLKSRRGFLFKGTWLCMAKCGLRELLIQELHSGALVHHLGVEKTYSMVKERYYWQKMSKDVEHFIKGCSTCQLAKSYVLPQGLYTPFPVPMAPREDISLTSSRACQELKGIRTPLWRLWTDSQRWFIFVMTLTPIGLEALVLQISGTKWIEFSLKLDQTQA